MPQPLEALAYHWWAARDALKAAAYNVRAGDGAGAGVHAHEDAIAFYERALECETDAEKRGAIVKKDRRPPPGDGMDGAKRKRRTTLRPRSIVPSGGARARSVLSRRRRDHRGTESA